MRKLLISTMAFLMLLPSIASAASAPDVLPDSIDILYQVDLSNIEILSDYMSNALQSELNIDQMDLAERILTDNTFELALNMNENADLTYGENIDTYVSLNVTAEDLDELLNEINNEYIKTTYRNNTVYDFTDSFGVHLNGIFYLTQTNEQAEQLIDNFIDKTNTLAQDDLYQRASEYFLENAFINLYINPSEVLSNMPAEESMMFSNLFGATDFTEEYMAALLSEAVSVAMTDDGFDFSVFVEGDLDMLKDLNMEMNKFEFTPELYKKLSGTDLMFYSESTNLKGAVDNIMEVSTEDSSYQAIYDGATEMFSEFSEQNFQTDILDLLDSNYMMTIHDSGQIIPSFTMIFDSSAHTTLAKANVAILNEKLKTIMVEEEKASGENFYTYGTTTIGDEKLPKHIINLKALMDDDSIIKTSDLRMNLTLGVTDNGMIIVSTHPNLGEIWSDADDSEGLLSNTGLSNSWDDPSKVITQIMYFDIDVLNQYVAQMMPKVETPEEAGDLIKGLLDPWHNMFAIGGGTENTTWATGNITVDISDLLSYEDLFTEYDAFMQEQMEQTRLTFFADTFCDVPSNAWFSDSVNALYYDGIIRGYDDGCFHPSDDISRAEFTKMVFSAAQDANLVGTITMSDGDKYFNDVPTSEWYWHYVNQAAANDMVNGYTDGSFKPNATITRAEAVQILYNASDLIQKETEMNLNNANTIMPFNDVSLNDWYGNAVLGLYNKGLISTDSSFAPGRNINRAEAAKLIFEFLELYK